MLFISFLKNFPKVTGTVTFKETKNGVLLTAKIHNLPQSKEKCTGRFFGFHIHEGTSCTGTLDDEFADAKMHYNPNNCIHPLHSGDLPPLIENNGFAYMSVLLNKFKLRDIIGKVIIIHEMPDDFTSQPSRKFRKENCMWKNSIILLLQYNYLFFLHSKPSGKLSASFLCFTYLSSSENIHPQYFCI